MICFFFFFTVYIWEASMVGEGGILICYVGQAFEVIGTWKRRDVNRWKRRDFFFRFIIYL